MVNWIWKKFFLNNFSLISIIPGKRWLFQVLTILEIFAFQILSLSRFRHSRFCFSCFNLFVILVFSRFQKSIFGPSQDFGTFKISTFEIMRLLIILSLSRFQNLRFFSEILTFQDLSTFGSKLFNLSQYFKNLIFRTQKNIYKKRKFYFLVTTSQYIHAKSWFGAWILYWNCPKNRFM